jgi:hypothetical protein
MKYYIYILLFIVVLFGCSEKSTEPKSSSASASISFSADTLVVGIGEEADMQLQLSFSGRSIFGISMRIDYRPNIVTFNDSTDFEVGDYFGTEIVSFVQSEENSIHLSISLIQGENPVNGSDDLGTLTFTGLSQGVSDIEIIPSELFFYNSDGNIITITDQNIDNAVISVQQ